MFTELWHQNAASAPVAFTITKNALVLPQALAAKVPGYMPGSYLLRLGITDVAKGDPADYFLGAPFMEQYNMVFDTDGQRIGVGMSPAPAPAESTSVSPATHFLGMLSLIKEGVSDCMEGVNEG